MLPRVLSDETGSPSLLHPDPSAGVSFLCGVVLLSHVSSLGLFSRYSRKRAGIPENARGFSMQERWTAQK